MKPRFRNFLNHDFLLEAQRNAKFDILDLQEIAEGAYDGDRFVFVRSPSLQWIFVENAYDFDRQEFCDWFETVSRVQILQRASWPELEVNMKPYGKWMDDALEMPCRCGPAVWELLPYPEVGEYISQRILPDDFRLRSKPDVIH